MYCQNYKIKPNFQLHLKYKKSNSLIFIRLKYQGHVVNPKDYCDDIYYKHLGK